MFVAVGETGAAVAKEAEDELEDALDWDEVASEELALAEDVDGPTKRP